MQKLNILGLPEEENPMLGLNLSPMRADYNPPEQKPVVPPPTMDQLKIAVKQLTKGPELSVDQQLKLRMRDYLESQKKGIGTLEDAYAKIEKPKEMNPILPLLMGLGDVASDGKNKLLPTYLQNQGANKAAYEDKRLKYLENIQKARNDYSKEEINWLGKQKSDQDEIKKELMMSQIYKNYRDPAAPKEHELKDWQVQSAVYGKRIEQAEDVFKQLEDAGYNRATFQEGAKDLFSGIPGMGNVTSEQLKMQKQAERNFINATLRRESGAVISASEFKNAEEQYLPRTGDTPEVIAQKRANRLQVMEGMKLGAGKGWDQLPQTGGGGTGGKSSLDNAAALKRIAELEAKERGE